MKYIVLGRIVALGQCLNSLSTSARINVPYMHSCIGVPGTCTCEALSEQVKISVQYMYNCSWSSARYINLQMTPPCHLGREVIR